ncbi:MAG: XdhC family protein [Pseudomonadota bacterium]
MPEAIRYIEHAEDVLAEAAQLAEAGAPFALVTSVAIKGGTARELGSLAVVTPGGEMAGYLSNGCIDRDIQVNGLAALEEGKARLTHYGAGSPFADLTLPCGGMLKVLIDPRPDLQAIQAASRALTNRKEARMTFTRPDGEGRLTISYRPKPKVTLAGRGAIFRATAEVAHSSGFLVSCLSPDVSDLEAVADFSFEPPVALKLPSVTPILRLDRWSAFLTLFHDHDWEPHLLAAALKTPCLFVGSLGSRQTHRTREARLEEMGVPTGDIARVRGPIGLVPSLRSANLIAVSTVAELGGVFCRSQDEVGEDRAALTL